MASGLGDVGSGAVFDPAIGEGALLQAVARRWPSATLAGADIDPVAVARVREHFPGWQVSQANALERRSRSGSYAWREARRKGVDYVVINPPFSFRGYGGSRIEYRGEIFLATPAMAFLAIVLEELRPRKRVSAVLPAGSLRGERDRELLETIRVDWHLDVTHELPRGAFPDVSASTTVLVVRPREAVEDEGPKAEIAPVRLRGTCGCVDIVRGRVPVHLSTLTADAGGVPWIHTTHLREGAVRSSEQSALLDRATIGSLVIVPRVGKFVRSKIALSAASRAVLSDCVFGLRSLSVPPEILRDDLHARSELLSGNYIGTGAPHLTIRRLTDFLLEIGYSPRHVPASADAPPCSCAASMTPATVFAVDGKARP